MPCAPRFHRDGCTTCDAVPMSSCGITPTLSEYFAVTDTPTARDGPNRTLWVCRAWHFTCGCDARGNSDATRYLPARLPVNPGPCRFLRQFPRGAALRGDAGAAVGRARDRALR